MAKCDKLHFKNISQESFNCLKKSAKKNYGINITKNSGEKTKKGFTVKWNYDPEAETLDVQCTDHPSLLVGCDKINKTIKEEVKKCR